MSDILEKVKVALRIKTQVFDEEEIKPLIKACKAELQRSGVNTDTEQPLIDLAVVLYCKSYFGADTDSDKYLQRFMALKAFLALGGGDNA